MIILALIAYLLIRMFVLKDDEDGKDVGGMNGVIVSTSGLNDGNMGSHNNLIMNWFSCLNEYIKYSLQNIGFCKKGLKKL